MKSDNTAKSYFESARQLAEDHNTEVFMQALRKYNVSWCSATPQQRCFIEEVVRIQIEREQALASGSPLEQIRPAFFA